MRLFNRCLATLMLLSVAAVVGATPVSAAPEIFREDEGYTGNVWVAGSDGSQGSSSSGCTYQLAATTIAGVSDVAIPIGGVDHKLYAQHCDGAFVQIMWIPLLTPADVLAIARDQLERKLPKPEPVMVWPDPDFDWAYAQVPIDYRVDAADCSTFEDTATASTPMATVSVTVRAQPASLQFISGDPAGTAGAACGGSDPVAAYLPAAPGVCSYTYTNASSTATNGRSFTAAMEISWDIDYWSTTDPGFAGTLPTVTRQTVFPVEVAEVKTLGIASP